jgi:hypothetical protein
MNEFFDCDVFLFSSSPLNRSTWVGRVTYPGGTAISPGWNARLTQVRRLEYAYETDKSLQWKGIFIAIKGGKIKGHSR